ncbi:MAG TPA: nickel-dependent lactate racemase [Dehalococcoidia bacterium]|jgi:nickel-dependent lactate racemase|nr:nickel-dependent lactate racemase [Dehalococcoidia bacterium]HIK89474.1 nickel-dependent lactate racemase [Dehalococcoidia bacterium]
MTPIEIDIPYGSNMMRANLPAGTLLGTLDVTDTTGLEDRDRAIREALENPIGLDKNIFEIVNPGETVAIVVPDSFRTTRIEQVLPVLIDGLLEAGISENDISFIYATGTHRGPAPEEERKILGDGIYQRFKDQAYSHDPRDESNLVYVGTTSRGTRVHLNKRVHEADRIIATGAVVLHYFGGFGGGRKSIVPGVASIESIASNHSMNLHPTEDQIDPAVRIGGLEGNPVAEDMLEATQQSHVDYIVNTVLNRNSEIAAVFAGELDAAHLEATKLAHSQFATDISEQADIVIAASPATQNFVQTHKALFNAYQAVKPDGRIILLAPCPEGLGGEQFAKWLRLGSREAIIAGLRKESEINGQTALSTIQKAPITYVVTEMTDDEVQMMRGRTTESLEDAISKAFADLAADGRPDPTVYLMPSAAYTVPFSKLPVVTAVG